MSEKEYINPMDVPAHLLEKYHRSGPRYTSYPTAPQFHSEFDRNEIIEKWRDTNESDGGISIYTHFPFCKTRCLYCGCYTRIEHSEELRQNYLDALKYEADAVFKIIDPHREVEQLALGGGTPTSMKAEQLADYIKHLENTVTFAKNAERSLEVDPRGVDEAFLEQLVEMRFNRFSFGVQDLDPNVQTIINRVLEEEKLQRLVNHLRKLDRRSVNLDLIYGLPGQTPESFGRTIEKIIAMKPTRIALFGYAHVPWVSPHQKQMEHHHIPNPEERMALFGTACDLLLKAGYLHVGMDHFALPSDELIRALNSRTLTRNFMGYTTRHGLDLIGLGASAISSVGSSYAQDEKDIDIYIENNQRPPWIKGLVMTPEDALRRDIIMRLFCNFHLDIEETAELYAIDFQEHFAAELDALAPMAEDGLMNITFNEIEVTQLGRFFIRNICMVFDQYLAKEKADPGTRYSKTI